MKKLRFLACLGLSVVLTSALFLGCPTDGETIVEETIIEDVDPSVFSFWLVHEFYQDTQRTTKVIIDAGNGKTFKASEFNENSFQVHALLTHYFEHSAADMANKVVFSGNRVVEYVHVTPSIENINQLAKRDFVGDDGIHERRQARLPGVEQGRYLVLELKSDREIDPGFTRTPGAEAGWIDGSQMIQHKMDYTIIPLITFNRYKGSTAEEIKLNSDYRYAKSTKMYNKNEFIPGDISVVFNLFEAESFSGVNDAGDAYVLNYRIYKPKGVSGKVPLTVWLHGNDGQRIVENATRWPNGVPEFLQNHGNLLSGSGAAVLANPVTQEKYGPFFVLAPQANGSHNPATYKAVIDKLLVDNPSIDPTRIYFGGTSMGGMGSLNMVIDYPGFVAAAFTGPGSVGFFGAPPAASVDALKGTPIWLVSTYGDNTGMDNLSALLFNALKDANGNVRWTTFPANTSGGGYPETNLVPGGLGWAHSAYEPMMSDKITTNYLYNVDTVTPGSGFGARYSNVTYGRVAPGDNPGDTLFAWLFKQKLPEVTE
ncbi:hypothetical protein FACS189450_03190 [Spirochaetia bacterium]|nr:hypothetical protein FACS189450_03190 [Spirochaetia bacterium]